MSYTYLREQGEESLAESFSDIPASVLSRLNLTADECYCNGSETESCHASRYGTTCARFQANRGEEKLMSSAEGSHAKTSAPPEKEQESKVQKADCGWKWQGSFAKWDRASYSWKTPQCSLLAGLDVFSETWPRWGIMRDGECLERTMSPLRTSETESGFWQTPVADDSVDREKGKLNSRGEPKLSAQVKMWPTPKVSTGDYSYQPRTKKKVMNLSGAVKMFPTPTVQDSKNNGAPSQMERNMKPLNAVAGGSLNPVWVEWLMGQPLGWTDSAPLGMDRFQQWLNSHGRF